MKEKIEAKLDARIELILSKDITDITPEEFMILKSKLSDMKFDEEKEERNKKYAETLANIMSL